MKSNQAYRHAATKSAPVQAKIKTPTAPAEFKIVRLRECPVDNPLVETPPQVADFWRKHIVTAPWFKDDKECLCVFLLNTRRRLLGFELVSQGTLDTILMHSRDVLRAATIKSAAAIIIAHNHPSGDPTPSDADVQVTRDLIQAARVLGIEILDHVIIGDGRRESSFASLRALGYFAPERATAPAERTAPGQTLSPNTGRAGVCGEAVAAFSELVPKSLAVEAKAALDDFQRAGSAAVALCMMNGDSLSSAVGGNQTKEPCPAAWNTFCDLSFEEGTINGGMIELSLQLVSEFKRSLSAWREDQLGMVSGEKRSEKSFQTIESATMSLIFLIRSQGFTLVNYYSPEDEASGPMECGYLVVERLNTAWRKSWALSNKLQDVFGGGQVAVN